MRNVGYTLRSAHIMVRDLAVARHYYAELLGMNLLFETEAYLGFDTGTCGLMIFAVPDKAESDTPTFLHFGVENIHALYEELKSRGVEFGGTPLLHDWGGIMVDVRDPDGNWFHLVQYPS